jgi:hypothetical protein
MLRLLCVLALAVAVAGPAKRPTSLKADLTFLTRDGCVNSPRMAMKLDDALKALGQPSDYRHLNISSLPKADERSGYPTPTILYKGHDLFGMPTPTPPYPEPS